MDYHRGSDSPYLIQADRAIVVVVVLLLYVNGKQTRSCRDGQLTLPYYAWVGLDLLSG